MSRVNYIIVAPPYDEYSGGSIVLHQLCHELNQLGEQAYLWPFSRLKGTRKTGLRAALKRTRRRWADKFGRIPFRRNPELTTPVAKFRKMSERDVVIYPEITVGNPLRARHVVRWLLHRPGFHTGWVDYQDGDVFYKFDDFAEVDSVTGGNSPTMFVFTLNKHYRDQGAVERKGSCYLTRKSEGVALQHELSDSVKIDGLSHAEVAAIFNRCETFYSYDEASMYSQFAAICGCTSVVIPRTFASREEWTEHHPLSKYGVAYGFDDLAHAQETRHLVVGHLQALEQQGIATVRQFVATMNARVNG